MICRVTSCPISSRPPQAPQPRSASKAPLHHFQIPKMVTRLLLSGLWSFPPSWPNPTDTLFSSHVAVSSFLEHSPRLAFVISLSLLTFRISVDLSFFSTVVSVSSLFHMWLLLRAQFYSPSVLASVPSFLFWICSPQVVSSFLMFNSKDMLMSTKFIIIPHTSQRSMLMYPTSYVAFLSIPETSQL